MKRQNVKSPKTKIQDQTHDSLPASVGLVKEVRDELRADIRSVAHGLQSVEHRLQSVEHRLQSVEHGIQSVDSKIQAVEHRLEAKIEQVNSKVELVLVSVHRSQVLMEEQRGENRIVLDGLKNLFVRQDRIENDFGELRGTVAALSAGAKR